ncbi:MAG: hypothetical protein KKE86_07415 [Planctomycetes bacterium]|nr:hypothetical protein [Planctomycetota bacterium]MBU4399148.1 hypothetical protein [Planctomycetota bacterium]MCG2685203.1 hypothetical protein [Planctomycetales bacterium]
MHVDALTCGLKWGMVAAGIGYVYETLDKLDRTLLDADSPRVAGLVELANLSSVLGNLLSTGIVRASNGVFDRAGPHKYQDLRANASCPEARNIEVKVSLETNRPKAHLPKEGPHLTCRYVLGRDDGSYTIGERGDVVWIWEVRFGHLERKHYNISNTEGDSGKTAVVNTDGMQILQSVYFDTSRCPYSSRSKIRQALELDLAFHGLGNRPSK